jgi:FkbM family methyltransferase
MMYTDKNEQGNTRNHFIATIVVMFCKFWTYRLGLKGGGALVRLTNRLFPKIRRFYLDFPGFGRCNIAFLNYHWLHMACRGLSEERSLVDILKSFSSHYPVVWDVGANSGYFAVELVLSLEIGKLVLFEPNPEHEETLRSLAAINSKIQVHMVGLSAGAGTAVLHVPGRINSGSACASLDKNVVSSASRLHSVNVILKTGDAMVSEGIVPIPDLIIMDVEGHEESALAGLAQTIEKWRPIIIIENIFFSTDALFRLVPHGYEVYTIPDKLTGLLNGAHKDMGHNFLLKPVNVADAAYRQ